MNQHVSGMQPGLSGKRLRLKLKQLIRNQLIRLIRNQLIRLIMLRNGENLHLKFSGRMHCATHIHTDTQSTESLRKYKQPFACWQDRFLASMRFFQLQLTHGNSAATPSCRHLQQSSVSTYMQFPAMTESWLCLLNLQPQWLIVKGDTRPG